MRYRILFAASLVVLAGCSTPETREPARSPLQTVSFRQDKGPLTKEVADSVAQAFTRAGANQDELVKGFDLLPPKQWPGMAHLVIAMPDHDLQSLKGQFLADNVALAYKAWEKSPWRAQVSEAQFFQYILPYASLNERRDPWRESFYERFREKAWAFNDPIDAAKWLNANFNDSFGVTYHATKRPKPDQSPFESIEAKYASCTGLSILLTDACRAVGIPARIVGVPKWKGIEGNHNWVEVWGGPAAAEGKTVVRSWHAVGEAGGDPRDLNWVHDRCRQHTDPDIPESRVYAAVHRPAELYFPLVWDESLKYVQAVNVTRFYLTPVEVELKPGTREAEVKWGGERIVTAVGMGVGAAPIKAPLAKGETFEVIEVDAKGVRTTRTITP